MAQQYKGMYPTLVIDIEGELDKLKVVQAKQKKIFLETLFSPVCSNVFLLFFRTMWSGSSPW